MVVTSSTVVEEDTAEATITETKEVSLAVTTIMDILEARAVHQAALEDRETMEEEILTAQAIREVAIPTDKVRALDARSKATEGSRMSSEGDRVVGMEVKIKGRMETTLMEVDNRVEDSVEKVDTTSSKATAKSKADSVERADTNNKVAMANNKEVCEDL